MKFSSKISLLLICLTFANLAWANEKMDSAIINFVQSKAMKDARVGVCVLDIKENKMLSSVNKDSLIIPASVTKTISSATALKTWTPEYKFKTEVSIDGIVNFGTLDGNLIIKAGLDPTLESRHFAENYSFVTQCVEAIKYAGIQKIKGKIIIDSDIYPDPTIPSRWDDSDIAEEYGAGAHALNYADNLCSIIVDLSGRKARIIDTIPHQRRLRIDNRMSISKDRKARRYPSAFRKKNSCKLTLKGDLRRQEMPIEVFTTTPDPADALSCDLEDILSFEGITVEGKKMKRGLVSQHLLTYESPELKDIVASLLERSDNMFAEAVLRTLGFDEEGVTSRQNAIDNEYRILTEWGVDTTGQILYDGSGLSRSNHYSPAFLASILRTCQVDESLNGIFPTLFPKVGMEGTVKKLLKDTPLEGKLVLKSGSMTRVQCYAGYYPLEDPQYVVVMMTNGFKCDHETLKKQIEQLFLELFI